MSTSERPSENGGALWALEAPWEPNGGKTPASRKQDRTVRKAEYAFESGWHHGETFVPGTALVGRVLRTGSFLQREGPQAQRGTRTQALGGADASCRLAQARRSRRPNSATREPRHWVARTRAVDYHRRGEAAAPKARHENPGTGWRGEAAAPIARYDCPGTGRKGEIEHGIDHKST